MPLRGEVLAAKRAWPFEAGVRIGGATAHTVDEVAQVYAGEAPRRDEQWRPVLETGLGLGVAITPRFDLHVDAARHSWREPLNTGETWPVARWSLTMALGWHLGRAGWSRV